MIQGSLNIKNGDLTSKMEFSIPENLSELKLSALVDFLVCTRSIDRNDPASALVSMAGAVSAFYGIGIDSILQSDSQIDSTAIQTVSQLFGYATNVISNFKPQLYENGNHVFEYNGEKYFCPIIKDLAISGEKELPALTVMEVVEVAEVNRWKVQATSIAGDPDGKLKKRVFDAAGITDMSTPELQKAAAQVYVSEVEAAGDPDGSLLYSYYLRTIAILCKKEGEQLPLQDSQREAWIQQRAFELQGIDAATALNMDFFLTSFSKSSGQSLGAVGFLRNQCFAAVAAIQLKKGKHTNGQSRRARRLLKRSAGSKLLLPSLKGDGSMVYKRQK